MKKVVFDAHAILTWMQAEKGHQKVKSLIMSCKDKSLHGYMSQINLGEVYYKTIRVVGVAEAKKFLSPSHKNYTSFQRYYLDRI